MLAFFSKISIVVSFLCLISWNLSGQNQQKIDSLKQLLQTESDDKKRVEMYSLIAQKSINFNFEEFELYMNKSINLAEQISDFEGLNNVYYTAGKMYYLSGYYENAIRRIRQAQQLSEQINDTLINAKSFNILGLIQKRQGNYDKSISLLLQSLELRQQLQDTKGVGLVYSNIASIYELKGNYEQALNYYSKSLEIAQEIGHDKGIANVYNNIGLTYKQQGKYAESLAMFLKGLAISEKINYKRVQVAGYVNIGIIHDVQKNYDKALEYYFKALKIKQETQDIQTIARIYTNIGITYKNQKLYQKALDFHFKSLEIKRKENNKTGMVYNYENIGECYFYQKKTEEALSYLQKGLNLSQEIGLKSLSARSLCILGQLHYDLKNYSKAKKLLSQGIDLATTIGEPIIIQQSVQVLAKIEKSQGNYQDAYQHYVLYKELSDSLFNIEKTTQIAHLNTKYETEKKEQQIKNLEQTAKIRDLQLRESTWRLVMLSIVLILLVLVGIILYLFYRQKQFRLQKKHHEVEQKLLRLQMNPHFIFNALAVIQKYMFDANGKKASFYLARFSNLMRQVLENSRHEYIALDEEITMLDNYLTLQNLRQKQPFTYEIEVDEQIETEEIAIPPMFAQPFVENAIEHGIHHLSEQGKIHIHFGLQDHQIILTIQDNGVGIQKAMEIEKDIHFKHQSLATQITKERILIFKQNYKKEVSFRIENLSQGTKVIFHLPYKYV